MSDVSHLRLVRRRPEPLWREAVGARLRRLRQRRGRTLVEVARLAGISPQYLSEIERGLKDPSSEILAAVSGALGVAVLEVTSLASEDLRHQRAWLAAQSTGEVPSAGEVSLSAGRPRLALAA
jgi:transcriptional regulator with XRE-family HTH domain